jgi:serine phosphatase RsbU (regulator of sigma subunit)
VLSVLLVYTVARGIKVGGFQLLWVQTAVIALVIAHELQVLRAIKQALQHQKDILTGTWAINVMVESQLPTLALLLLLASQWMTPYQVLVAPAVLIYFLLIILSTLRLSPSLTVLTGLMSALGYLFVTFYIEAKFQTSRVELGAFPLSIYVIYGISILIAGIIGAVVSARIQGYVAAALREAELRNKLHQVNHDLDIARSIQQDLLPSQSPSLEDFDLAGWNQPANETGGDYFDWQTLPDGRIAISLADATGHGIGPALVSTSCRAYSRASLLAGAEKNGLLDRLNGLLTEDLSENLFVTFVVVFLDPANARMKIFSAGHGPILWYRYGADKIENLEAHGIPLGMIASAKYNGATEGYLAPGDMLVLVSDGFYEWENPDGEQFGLNRLQAMIRESRDCSAEGVIARLRSSVGSFSKGTEQKDDLTAVVLKRKFGSQRKTRPQRKKSKNSKAYAFEN